MRKVFASIALVGTLALTACGGAEPASSPTAPSAAPVEKSEPAKAPDASKSERGNIIKTVGQGASITDSMNGNKEIVTFVVNSITPGACTEPYAQPPKNGNIIVLDVTVETKPELADAIMPTYSMSPWDFKYVAPNGTTFNGDLAGLGYGCLPAAETFPSAGMGPAEKITAKVVLDVPQPNGTLVLKAPLSNTNGWEYAF